METLIVSRDARLRQHENTISILLDGKKVAFPVEKIRHIILLAESTLTTKLLNLCGKHGVRLSIFDFYGYCKGCFEPVESNPSGVVKLAQARVLLEEDNRMFLARQIVRGAAGNMRANLSYYQYRGINTVTKMVLEIKKIENRLAKCMDPMQLMGFEGNMHQWYYTAWKFISPSLSFGKRIRRPPNNMVNCLLSFLNQLTYTVVRHELCKTHLEQTFSVLHAPGFRRASLSLDIAEPFKPVLVDVLIFRMARKGGLKENWFSKQKNVCMLTETGRRHVSEQFIRRLEKNYNGRSYREWIYREGLKFERHLLEIEEYEPFQRKV